MPLVTCPNCLAKFDSTGRASASCPTCGVRLDEARSSRRRATDDDPPRSRRSRTREEDEDEDDVPRRPRRKKVAASSGDALVPLLLIGGVIAAAVIVGGFGYLMYKYANRARDVAGRRSDPPPPAIPDPGWVPPAPVDFNPPPVDGANPGFAAADPALAPPPDFNPGDQPMPGMDPAFPQPPPAFPQVPPGFPQPPGAFPPGGPPPGMPQGPFRPPGMPIPGQPPGMQPPGMPQPPGVGGATVVLSNLRRARGLGLSDELEVDYEYTAGTPNPFDKLVVKTANGTGEVDLVGIPRQKGTVRIRAFGFGKLQGRLEVWMERRTLPGRLGGPGQVISNTVTLG